MELTEPQKNELIRYRIKQAETSYEDVKLLIAHKKWSLAVSRIYYGMFYMLLAIGLKKGFESSKHQTLIGWFNKTFIKTGVFPVRYGKMIHETYKNRQKSDYEVFVNFTEEFVLLLHTDMKDFIETLKNYLLK